MPDVSLIVADPGHFHAALVQKEMYPNLSPEVHVYAPLGPDLADYLTRIARFNTRKEQPTHWKLEVTRRCWREMDSRRNAHWARARQNQGRY